MSCNFHVFQHLSQGNFSLGFVGVGGDGRLILFLFICFLRLALRTGVVGGEQQDR